MECLNSALNQSAVHPLANLQAGMDTNLRTFSFNGRDYILQLWDIAGELVLCNHIMLLLVVSPSGGLLAQHALLPVSVCMHECVCVHVRMCV